MTVSEETVIVLKYFYIGLYLRFQGYLVFTKIVIHVSF